MPTKITLNPGYAGGVYVLNHDKFITCLGFDVVLKKAAALASELNSPEHFPDPTERGSITAYRKYAALVEKARQKNRQRMALAYRPDSQSDRPEG